MRMTRFAGRPGLVLYQLVLILLAIIVIVVLVVHFARSQRASAAEDALGAQVTRPRPREITFDGCPPVGDGGDHALNLLKNRVDSAANPVSLPFEAAERLPWPRVVDRSWRSHWSARSRSAVARYEGAAVVVEGYLAGARMEGPESPNCHGADTRYRDWHLWLTSGAYQDRSGSMVVETTPRVRAEHPAWRIGLLEEAARRGTPVRVTGWLMLDEEHPEQLGRTRGTLWEIHPITAVQLETVRGWASFDSLGARSARSLVRTPGESRPSRSYHGRARHRGHYRRASP